MLPSVDVVRDAEEDGDDFVFESMDGEAMSAGPVCGACLSPRLILLPGGTDHCGIVIAGDEDVPLHAKLVDVCEHIQESILSDLPDQEWETNDAVSVFVQLGKLLDSSRYASPM